MKFGQRVRAALTAFRRAPRGLSMVDDSRGWTNLWLGAGGETTTGSWQRDEHIPIDQTLAFFAVYACVTQIAGDIGKLCLRLMERDAEGIWTETESPSFSPFLRKPNHFQTTQQFVESWEISKLTHGNTLALKEYDQRRVVIRQYVLDWERITPLVAPDGSVFYEARQDDLSHLPVTKVAIPASEVIHDRMNCLFHPLIGVSPLFACGLAASQGLSIQRNSGKFFANMSRPSGVLTAPAKISDETAARLKRDWENNFGSGQIGKVAVLGDAMKYEAMAVTPEDAQLVDQLKLSAEQVCSAFGVPKFMVGVGDTPGIENAQVLTQWYYDRCLQKLIEAFERLQDDGLGLTPNKMRTEFDLDDLLRMDSKSLAETEGILVQRGISSPNESRRKFNKPPVPGGAQPYLQQQNFSLEALAKRDGQDDPFKTNTPVPTAPAANDDSAAERAEAAALETLQRMTDLGDRIITTQGDQQRQLDEEREARAAEVLERRSELDAQRETQALLCAMAEQVDGYIAQAHR